MHKMLF